MGRKAEEGDSKGRDSRVNHYIRNPIKRHGDLPESHFTQVSNSLVREQELSNHAYRIALVLRSHAHDFQVSAASLAKTFRWHRDTVAKALRELQDARWLAVRRIQTPDGNRIYDEYHVHLARQFTDAEMADLCRPLTLAGDAAPGTGSPPPLYQAAPCPVVSHPPDHSEGTKEEQIEDQSEQKSEDHSSTHPTPAAMSLSESPGWSLSDFEGPRLRRKVADGEGAARSDESCWGCMALGPGCAVHAQHLQIAAV